MIRYSTTLRKNLAKPEEAPKAYASVQVTEKVDLSKFAAHIASHSSAYDKGDIMAIATKLVSELREALLAGKKVSLGDLGEFSVAIKSKGAPSLAEFTAANITALTAVWEPGDEFQDMLKDAEFEYSLTRDAEAEAKKAAKGKTTADEAGTGSDTKTDTPTTDTGSGSGSSSGGGNTGGLGD